MTRLEAKADIGALIGRIVSTTISEDSEDILVPINPHFLFQYIYGVLARPLGATSTVTASSSLVSASVTIFSNFPDLPDIYNEVALPKAIIKLRKMLETKRSRGTSFTADWSSVTALASDLVANGITNTNLGQNYVNVAGYLSGFALVTGSVQVLTNVALQNFLGEYDRYYKLIMYSRWKGVSVADASAFSFDAGGLIPVIASNQSNLSSFPTATIAAQGGWSSAGGQMFMKQSGDAGLEVPILSPEIAAIRLGTYCALPTTTASPGTAPTRRPQFVIQSNSLPSTLGYNASGLYKVRGRMQLKPLSAFAVVQALINKLETLAANVPSLVNGVNPRTLWLSTLSSNDVKMICYAWWRNSLKAYSGSAMGTWLITPGTAAVAIRGTAPEFHSGYAAIAIAKVPEFASKILGAYAPVVDEYSTLVPWFTILTMSSLTTTLTYTGTDNWIFPGPNTESQAGNVDPTVLGTTIGRYKQFEQYLSMVENLSAGGTVGRSLLGTTTLVDVVSTGPVIGFSSRTPITDSDVKSFIAVIASMTYDVILPSSQIGVLNTVYASKEYSQKHRVDLTLGVSIAALQVYSNLDGIVANGFTSNESDAKGTNNSISVLPSPLESPVRASQYYSLTRDKPNVSNFAERWLSRLIPRAGNYCGPGWTAGVDTFATETVVDKSGKYTIIPTDLEDAVCKRHDEAYRGAEGDATKILLADNRMVAELEDIRVKDGLSFYGHAAQLAIRLKATDLRRLLWGVGHDRDEL